MSKTLPMEFTYSYSFHGKRYREMSVHPSTMTWEQVIKYEEGIVSWRSDFAAVERTWPAYAWPGGYPLFYVLKDGEPLCPKCANKELDRTLDSDDEDFFVTGVEINYEDSHLYCIHCNLRIPSAYSGVEEA